MVVKTILEKWGLHPLQIELGEVILEEQDISFVKENLQQELQSFGFDLLDDKKTTLTLMCTINQNVLSARAILPGKLRRN